MIQLLCWLCDFYFLSSFPVDVYIIPQKKSDTYFDLFQYCLDRNQLFANPKSSEKGYYMMTNLSYFVSLIPIKRF